MAKKSIFAPVYGTVYVKGGEIGDFGWMIQQPKYKNSLFIFNDNTTDHTTSRRGAGNAIIRPYNIYGFQSLGLDKPLSAGIPTGTPGRGFSNLDKENVRENIDGAIEEIKHLLKKYKYNAIYYSASGKNNPLLGTGIFSVSDAVKKYITKKIHLLGKFRGIKMPSSSPRRTTQRAAMQGSKKTPRKHAGIVQKGQNKGRLKKGYTYSGGKTKTGLPLIVSTKK